MRARLLGILGFVLACSDTAGPDPVRTLHDRIVFVSDRPGYQAFFAISPDGTGLEEILTGRRYVSNFPAIAPGGQQVAYTGADWLWVQAYPDGTPEEVAEHPAAGGQLVHPRWRPDGKVIASAAGELLLTDPATGEIESLFPGTAGFFAPDWSPDGEELVVSWSGEGPDDLYIVDVAARTTRPLVTRPGVERYPRWSPDGRYILYMLYDGEPQDSLGLRILDLATGRDSLHVRSATCPCAWAPDSRRLVLVDFDITLPRLAAYDLATGEISPLLEPEPLGFDAYPDWGR